MVPPRTTRRRFLQGSLVSTLLLPLASACSGQSPAPTPSPPSAPPTPVSIVAGPTASPSPSPSPQPVAVRRSLTALAYTTDSRGNPAGATSPIGLTLTPGPKEEFRLGFFETDVGQLGPSWRATGWMAALLSTLETGKELSTVRASWDTKGYVDGPSAGGLMTSGFMSALLGDPLSPDVGMTGTINPDGTIGPVGGIQWKLEAAAKEKMKTVLVPLGQRNEYDENTDKTVDLVAKGQSLGITVKEVATLDEAYEALTGKPLPRTPGPSRAPDLSAEAYDKIKPKIAEWTARYNEEMGRYKRAIPNAQKALEDNAAQADDLLKRSQAAQREGSIGVAYEYIQDAVLSANSVAIGANAIEAYLKTQDINQAVSSVLQTSGSSQVDAMVNRLKAYQPNTPTDAIMGIAAWSELLQAVALDDSAASALQQVKKLKDEGEQLGKVVAAAVMVSAETWVAKAAEDLLTLNLAKPGSAGQKPDPAVLESWAGLFKTAAQANQSYFDALILDDVAQSLGLRLDAVKATFINNNFGYMIASYGASPGSSQYLEKAIGKTPALSLAQLGFSMGSFLACSELIAKYYSLDAKTDEDGNVTGFGRERVLSSMLDNAADRAKERIAAADKAGHDVSLPILYFQNARADRERGPEEKLSALRKYWTASLFGRLLTLLGGAR